MTSTEKVIQKAIELVDSCPAGKRYSDLVKEISGVFPEHSSQHRSWLAS